VALFTTISTPGLALAFAFTFALPSRFAFSLAFAFAFPKPSSSYHGKKLFIGGFFNIDVRKVIVIVPIIYLWLIMHDVEAWVIALS